PDVKEPPAPNAPAASQAVQGQFQLHQLTADQMHDRLQKALGRELPIVGDAGGDWLRFSVDAGDGAAVLLAANRQSGEVRIVGRREQLRAWRPIVSALDAPAAANAVTQV